MHAQPLRAADVMYEYDEIRMIGLVPERKEINHYAKSYR